MIRETSYALSYGRQAMPETNDRNGREVAQEENSRDPAQGQPRVEIVAQSPYSRVVSIDGKNLTTKEADAFCGPDCDPEQVALLFITEVAEKCGRAPFACDTCDSEPKGRPRRMSADDISEVTR
jgi:hypothetical protein